MTIKPELGAGFRDYLPQDAIPRQQMFAAIQRVFELFGYQPLATPAIEREEILTGGDPNFDKQIFRIAGQSGDKDLALRFDLTVPLARVIAAYPQEIKMPFKRYQVGSVWRAEKSQAGRFREFIQFDADIVGAPGMMGDAEIIAIIYAVMIELGFGDRFKIRVNNRKILNGLAAYAGFSTGLSPMILRAIDKMDKIGWEGVARELATATEDFSGLSEVQIAALRRFVEIQAADNSGILEAVSALMGNSNDAMQGVAELREILDNLKALKVPDSAWVIDLSVARGLGYYTGPVFETILTDIPELGSVFSGGRYDDLVMRFSSNKVPATGASVGVDRIFAAMEKLKLVRQQKSVAKVVVLNFDPTCSATVQGIVSTLRSAGVSTNLYLGQEKTLKGQLSYAVSQDIPVVVIIGATEKNSGMAQVKDLKAKLQIEVPQGEIISAVQKILT